MNWAEWEQELLDRERKWEPKPNVTGAAAGIVWWIISAAIIGAAIWCLKH